MMMTIIAIIIIVTDGQMYLFSFRGRIKEQNRKWQSHILYVKSNITDKKKISKRSRACRLEPIMSTFLKAMNGQIGRMYARAIKCKSDDFYTEF